MTEKQKIYTPSGKIYAELWVDCNLLQVSVSPDHPEVILNFDKRIIPQLITALQVLEQKE